MGPDCLTVKKAWALYDHWLDDPRVTVRWDSPGVDPLFRLASSPLLREQAPKALADAYLLAMSRQASATLVTLDRGLASLAANVSFDALLL